MANLYTYVPSLVDVSIFGVKLKGFSSTNIVDIERDLPANTFRKAQDGSRTAFRDRYASYRVTIHLDQTSESNTLLHLIFKLYQKTNVEFKMPITITEKNNFGGTKFSAVDCFFDTEATTNFMDESSEKTWTFICHNANYSQAGTYEDSEYIESFRSVVRMLETAEAVGLDLGGFKDKLIDSAETIFETAKSKFGGRFE